MFYFFIVSDFSETSFSLTGTFFVGATVEIDGVTVEAAVVFCYAGFDTDGVTLAPVIVVVGVVSTVCLTVSMFYGFLNLSDFLETSFSFTGYFGLELIIGGYYTGFG